MKGEVYKFIFFLCSMSKIFYTSKGSFHFYSSPFQRERFFNILLTGAILRED